MDNITLLGIDLAKNIFQLHGVDKLGRTKLKRTLRRRALVKYVSQLPVCTIAMEACSSSNHFSRKFQKFGHEVKIISPQFVTPFVQSNKNDAADAEAICEAASRLNMRFVSTKSVAQQDIQCLHRVRKRLVGNRTSLTNEIRSILGEFGIVFSQGRSALEEGIKGLLNGSHPPEELSSKGLVLLQALYSELLELDKRIEDYELKLEQIARQPQCQRLLKVGGLGILSVTALTVALADPEQFKNGRNFAAWLGLVPKHVGTGGKSRILGISKRGNTDLRTLLIHGARAKLRGINRKFINGTKLDPLEDWAYRLCQRQGFNKATVALANKNARIAWSISANKTDFDPKEAVALLKEAA
jgi:transposase